MLAETYDLDRVLIVGLIVVGGPLLWRVAGWVMGLFKYITFASWGVVLEGSAGAQQEVLEGYVLAALRGVGYDNLQYDYIEESGWGKELYVTVSYAGHLVHAGAHKMGSDLYVSWNVRVRRYDDLIDHAEWGLNRTNYVRAFLNSTLAATQRAVESYVEAEFGRDRRMTRDQLEASGSLGPLRPAINSPSRPGHSRSARPSSDG
jgi:hypothetical protein